MFQIGNGTDDDVNRANALTILKNGNTAIGVAGTEATAKPTELLDLGGTATAGNGGLKIRNINSAAYTGDIETDKLVVADADGVLKTVDASTIASTEPWKIQSTTTDATANTQDIYQQGKVAVGFTVADGVSDKQLEVKGDIKSVTNNAGTYSVLETNNTDFGTPINVMFTANNPDIMAATTYASVSTFPGQVTLNIQGSNGNSIGIDNEDAQILVENVATGRYNRINIGNNGTEVVDNIMLESSNLSSTIFSKLFVDQNKGVTFKFKPTFGLEGNYTFPKTNGAANQVLVTNGVSPTTGAQLSWADVSSLVDINEPWRVAGTTNEATDNTQSIYQNASVGIGDFSFQSPIATLDVRGSVRGGIAHWGTAGQNSVAFGTSNVASGANSAAIGSAAFADGDNSVALGNGSQTHGFNSFAAAGGYAMADNSVVLLHGSTNAYGSMAIQSGETNGQNSVAIGAGAITSSFGEIVMGRWNAITTGGDANNEVLTDAAFQFANGTFSTPSNALTILKNGNIGTDLAIAPTERLDIGSGNVRVRDINTVTGAATDNIVVADANGVLKTVAVSTIASTEPWQVQGGTTEATANAENIYQTGSVAIGASTIPAITVGATTVNPMLHIAGDVSTTGKYYTTNSVYADYVFEKYFKGTSKLNPGYEFKSLEYVKNFIEENHHLPGVASIADLEKAENGYTFDMTQLTVQSLEKIEELYIHTIEQKDKIDQQQSEIEDMKSRLERLESLLSEKK